MTLDAALNLVWAAIGLSSLSTLGIFDIRRRFTASARVRRIAAVLLVSVSLFPCVSASDDLLSASFFRRFSHQGGFGNIPTEEEKSNQSYLIQVLQALENFQVQRGYGFNIHLVFISLVFVQGLFTSVVERPRPAGRSPPVHPFVH